MDREQIGRVILDYRYYPGEDKYSDGAIEDEMLELAKKHRGEEMEAVIAGSKSWPILYHFSHVRENIIEWLPMDGTEQVLEIGSGPGAITGVLAKKAANVTCIDLSRKRSLINAYRHSDCDNLKILVGNFQDIERNMTEQFDLITLIGVFEYAQFSIQSEQPFTDYLNCIRRHLKPGGRLVIAIENRLGLKYWAGATEDHTGVYFEGLEGYPTTDYVRTFSKPELETLLQGAGFASQEFYYPYPDYKLPDRVYSGQYLPKKGELNQNRQNFDRERIHLFSEARVYDSLADSGLFPLYSNSFFVIAKTGESEGMRECTDDSATLFTKYSNERSHAFRIRTDIRREQDGTKSICKMAADPAAAAHIKGIYDHYLRLKEDLDGTGLTVNACRESAEGVHFPFVTGQTLEEKLDGLLAQKKTAELTAEIGRYFAMFAGETENGRKSGLNAFNVTPQFTEVFGTAQFAQTHTSRAVSDVDMIFSNAIERGDGYELIDYEWTFDFPVPLRFIQYRCLSYYIYGSEKRAELAGLNLFEHFGISREEQEQFAKMERCFQHYILGTYTPNWKLYDTISDGVISVMPIVERESRRRSGAQNGVEVYFDDGRGFGTWSCERYHAAQEGRFTLTAVLPKGTKQMRVDPCGEKCIVRVLELSQNGKTLAYTCNGERANNGDLIFDTEDPQIIFETAEDGNVVITFITEPLEGLCRELVWNQHGRIRWMEQTKIWKGYRKLKRMIKGTGKR